MEWVETTGRTVEDAKEAALDELGVDEGDAEFEIIEEPRSGLFGRLRQEARVRARVRPSKPRAKLDRRDRRRRGRERPAEDQGQRSPVTRSAQAAGAGSLRQEPVNDEGNGEMVEEDAASEASASEVGETASSFVEGLSRAFGADAALSVEQVDEETVEVRLDGDDLGLLIGPKGQTLGAVQELARTVVQRRHGLVRGLRVNVDIAGYRQRRRVALEGFTRKLASDVLANGRSSALEPMAAVDRKVVHDTANAIAGIRTVSEGEEPRRRVVLMPDEDATGEND